MAIVFHAHSGTRSDESDWQPLASHLRNVARYAAAHAAAARPRDGALATTASIAGVLHDLGKYRPEFQAYIRGRRGAGEATRHKQIGAAHAVLARRIDLALAILGHHGGMPDKADLASTSRDARPVLTALWETAKADCPEVDTPIEPCARELDPLAADLQTRLLFSCLVDADWLDTSDHAAACHGWPARTPPLSLDASTLLARVRRYIDLRAAGCRDAEIAALRAAVLYASLDAAVQPSGLFSLTVPTGGGKTLASLAFALAHAAQWGLRRVIYVAPYLSVIEQNARVFREALDDAAGELILEHHSMAEPRAANSSTEGGQSEAAQRLAENWDAPVVLTTSVQFYETLFANEPGRCRKFHNIARSVVILDECQTLRPGLTAPTCQMLQQMADYMGCSIVLCTATQPAWNRDPQLLPEGLTGVREIAPAGLDLFQRLKRVHVRWPAPSAAAWEWPEVARHLLARHQALCVVNSKQAARDLYSVLRSQGCPNLLHLSTAMCPAHRLIVLDAARELLRQGAPCHLVSTQLIEAGVDIDFPLVLRELAPLESIAQAAGRCNREGLLKPVAGVPGGEVIVFRSVADKIPLDAWYRNGIAVVKHNFLQVGRQPDIHQPRDLAEYYRRLYRTGELDREGILDLRRALNFPEVARHYRLIDDLTIPVVITTWDPAREKVESLLSVIRRSPTRCAYRQLQRFSVNLYEHDLHQLGGSVQCDHLPGVNLCSLPYDPALGLVPGASSGALVL